MKTKLLFLLFFGLITASLSGKKVILFHDDFSNGLDQWTTSYGWTLIDSYYAGGNMPELCFLSTSTIKTSRISSSVIDISKYREGSLFISLKQQLQKTAKDITIAIDISSNGGKTWKSAWNSTESFNAQEFSFMIDPSLITSDSLQFSFSINGRLYGMKEWLIDDVELCFLEKVQTKMIDLVLEKEEMDINEKNDISISFENIGTENISSMEICYQIGSNNIVSEIIDNLNVKQGDISEITFSAKAGVVFEGNYTVKAWIRKVNGDAVDSEIMTKKLVIKSPVFIRKNAMIEWFTGYGCDPCITWKNWILPRLQKVPEKYVCATYRMAFKGGDIYDNADAQIKRRLYNVTGIPTFIINGVIYPDRDTANVMRVVNHAYEQPAEASIEGFFKVSQDSSISIKIILLPYVTGKYNINVAVNQTEILNYGTQGDINNTMMKMLPDGNGKTYSFVEGEPIEINLSADLSRTLIKDYTDLEVAVFLQKFNSKEITTSKYLDKTNEDIIYPPVNFEITNNGYKALLEWERHPDADENSWFIIYRDGEKIKDSLTSLSYIDEGLVEGIYTYYIAAKYGDLTSAYQKKSIVITSDISVPYNVVVDAANLKSFLITWEMEDDDDIAGYNIYREGTKINKSLIIEKQYNDNLLYEGDAGYCYKITAVSNNDTESGYSDIVCSSPFVPVGIQAEQIYSDTLEVKIEWEKGDDILTYNIYRDSVKINEEPLTEAVYFDRMSKTGNFCYTVTAVREDFESEYSEKACVEVTGVLVIPKIYTLEQLTSSKFEVELEWNMMTDLEIEDESYNIYRDGEKINTEPVTSKEYIDTTIDTVGSYCYQVVFINNTEGKFSEERCIEVTAMNLVPVNVLAKQKEHNNKNVIIEWSPVDAVPVEGYNIYRDDKKINKELLAELVSYKDSVNEFNKEYCYSVTAVIDSIECLHSEKSCVTLEGNDLGIPQRQDIKETFNIYPNPVKDVLYINSKEVIKICNIYNINGKQVDKLKGNVTTISTKKWSSGIYIIELITEKGKYSKQIIKE